MDMSIGVEPDTGPKGMMSYSLELGHKVNKEVT